MGLLNNYLFSEIVLPCFSQCTVTFHFDMEFSQKVLQLPFKSAHVLQEKEISYCLWSTAPIWPKCTQTYLKIGTKIQHNYSNRFHFSNCVGVY